MNPNLMKPKEKLNGSAKPISSKINYYENSIQWARNNGFFHSNAAYLHPKCCKHPNVPGRRGYSSEKVDLIY